MIRKLTVVLLTGVICLIGITSALAVTYNEAPMLRTLVAAGELPPVEERLPEEPCVRKVPEIGQYGGTLHTFGISRTDAEGDMSKAKTVCDPLLGMKMDGTIIGNLAKGYELSDDAKTLTLYLRKGLKWSDGYPFTADDILFMYEDIHWNDLVQSQGDWFGHVLKDGITKIDDYTVRYELDQPSPAFPMHLCTRGGSFITSFAPKHYLKKWHIDYNPNADKLAKEEGFDHWYECFYSHFWLIPTKDLNTPVMGPWMPKESGLTTIVDERNPYFWQVDEEGNQLPYIDEIVCGYVDVEAYQMKIISGEADLAIYRTSLKNYPLYKENEEEGGYRVIPFPGIDDSAKICFSVNQNNPDPFLGPLLRDVRFRQALSVAINREEINEACYFGLGTPAQATCLPSCSYYKEEWARAYAQYDPDMANRLLDEIGLTERGKDGFRVDPAGEPILLLVEYPDYKYEVVGFELVKEYWEDVGLKTMAKGLSHGVYNVRGSSLDLIMSVHPYEDVGEVSAYMWGASRTVPGGRCTAWYEWLCADSDVSVGRKKLEDFEDGKLPGEEPPEEVKQQWDRGQRLPGLEYGSEEYMQTCEAIYDYQAENLYAIGVVGMVPVICIVKEDLGNFPTTLTPWYRGISNLEQDGQQFFWKK